MFDCLWGGNYESPDNLDDLLQPNKGLSVGQKARFLPTRTSLAYVESEIKKEDLKEIILSHNRELTWIRDGHQGDNYQLGKLLADEKDPECYYFQPILNNKDGEAVYGKAIRLHYHDLKSLQINSNQIERNRNKRE